jgi:hypothetical protein
MCAFAVDFERIAGRGLFVAHFFEGGYHGAAVAAASVVAEPMTFLSV